MERKTTAEVKRLMALAEKHGLSCVEGGVHGFCPRIEVESKAGNENHDRLRWMLSFCQTTGEVRTLLTGDMLADPETQGKTMAKLSAFLLDPEFQSTMSAAAVSIKPRVVGEKGYPRGFWE